eukprot:6337604-Pyramimonas_sp.AAC.1
MTTGDLSEEVTRKLGEANLLYALEKYDGAIHLLKETPSRPPLDPRPKLGEANLLYAVEKYDGAIHLLKESGSEALLASTLDRYFPSGPPPAGDPHGADGAGPVPHAGAGA